MERAARVTTGRLRQITALIGLVLTGLLPTASAQEIQRTGGGSASIVCAFSVGPQLISCLGPGTTKQILSTPNGTASVSDNVTISGMSGNSQITMSAGIIQVSGNASFVPPPSCSEGSVGGQGPTYFASGSQSVYADVPNGTPIKITINASRSATGGGGASWSVTKSGVGSISTPRLDQEKLPSPASIIT